MDYTAVGCSWLPLTMIWDWWESFDAAVYGRPQILMSPMSSFLQRPSRWLQTISKYRVTTSGGPNFSYQLCVDKVTEEEMKGLDLSSWSVCIQWGRARPLASTLKGFSNKFASVGFRHESHLPCYGMAETTLIVTGGPAKLPPIIHSFDSLALDARLVQRLSANHPRGRELVGCGRNSSQRKDLDCRSAIACHSRRRQDRRNLDSEPECGELGYWEKSVETQDTFKSMTRDGQGPFLRTGDLGFFDADQLFVAGRVKDLIIVRSVNRYPQDIEQTVEECHESVPSSAAATFADTTGTREKLIIAVESRRKS
ncbi:MAG: AMP-binding protein [Pirellulales bacterium]